MTPSDDPLWERIWALLDRASDAPAEERAASLSELRHALALLQDTTHCLRPGSDDPGAHQAGNERPAPALQPTRLTPELREWALRQATEEEILSELAELRAKGGRELGEVLAELDKELDESERGGP